MPYDPNCGAETAGQSNRWRRRWDKWKRALKYRYFKYFRFGGKERELIMKARIITRVSDSDFD